MSTEKSMEHAGGKLLAEVSEGIGTITFNQPEKRNAMSVEMWTGLEQVLRAWESDDGVRVVVLTGAGDKAFMSGADISQFEKQRNSSSAMIEYNNATGAGRAALANFPKAVIARIQGYCLGGGVSVATQADLRIASADAKFGVPAARLGNAYALDSVRSLAVLVGSANARMILMGGGQLDAQEALRIGLVNQVVAAADLNAAVLKLAQTIAENAPLSVRAAKQALNMLARGLKEGDERALEQAIKTCVDSDDYREGRTAFMEKRAPRFTGR